MQRSLQQKSMFPITYSCALCKKKVKSTKITGHDSICIKKSINSMSSYKLDENYESKVSDFLSLRIQELRISINSSISEASSSDGDSINESLKKINKKLNKLYKLKARKSFITSELFYLEKSIIFTTYLSNSSKIYNLNKMDYKKLNFDCFSRYFRFYSYTLKEEGTSISMEKNFIAYSNTSSVSVYDCDKELIIFRISEKKIYCVDLIVNKKQVAYNFKEKYIKIMNFRNSNLVAILKLASSKVLSFKFSKDKSIIIANYMSQIVVSKLSDENNKVIVTKEKNDKIKDGTTYFVISLQNGFFIYFNVDIVVYNIPNKCVEEKIIVDNEIINLTLFNDDNTLLYSTRESINIHLLNTKQNIYSFKYNFNYFIDKTCSFLYFENEIVFDINRSELGSKHSQENPIKLMKTNSYKNFSINSLKNNEIFKDQQKYFIQNGTLKIATSFSNSKKNPCNSFLTKCNLKKFFQIENKKVLVVSVYSKAEDHSFLVFESKKMFIFTYCDIWTHLNVSNNLRYLIFNQDNIIKLWDILNKKTLDEYFEYFGHNRRTSASEIVNFQVTPSKRYLLINSKSGILFTLKKINKSNLDIFDSKIIKFHRERQTLALILKKGYLNILDLNDQTQKGTLSVKGFRINQIFFKVLEQQIIIVSETLMIIFNITTLKIDFKCEYNQMPYFEEKLSPGNSHLVLVSNHSALIIKLSTPRFKKPKSVYNLCLKSKEQVDFSLNNSYLLIAEPCKLFIYNLPSCKVEKIIDLCYSVNRLPTLYIFGQSKFSIVLLIELRKQNSTEDVHDNVKSVTFCVIDMKEQKLLEKFNHDISEFSGIKLIQSERCLRLISHKSLVIMELKDKFEHILYSSNCLKINEKFLDSICCINSINILDQFFTKQNEEILNHIKDIVFTHDGSKMFTFSEYLMKLTGGIRNQDGTFTESFYNKIDFYYIFKQKYIFYQTKKNNWLSIYDLRTGCERDLITYKEYKLTLKIFTLDDHKVLFYNKNWLLSENESFYPNQFSKLIILHQENSGSNVFFVNKSMSIFAHLKLMKIKILLLKSMTKITYTKPFYHTIKQILKNKKFIIVENTIGNIFLLNLENMTITTSIHSFYDSNVMHLTSYGDFLLNYPYSRDFICISSKSLTSLLKIEYNLLNKNELP